MLALQGSAGNRAVQRLVVPVQRALGEDETETTDADVQAQVGERPLKTVDPPPGGWPGAPPGLEGMPMLTAEEEGAG